MKKRSLLGILLFIVSVFVLVGCHDPQSETPVEVTAFIVAVDEIGTVTTESGLKIDACYVLYDELSDEHKERDDVKGAKTTLDGHKTTYDELIGGQIDPEETKIATFLAAVTLVPKAENISETTLTAAKAAVKTAENAYNSLSATSKDKTDVKDAWAKVTAAKNKITEVETAIAEKDDREAANAFIAAVEAIGTVDLNSKSKIDNAQVLYEALSAKALTMSGVSDAAATLNQAKLDYQAALDNKAGQDFKDAVARIENAGGGVIVNDGDIDSVLEMYEALSVGAKAVAGVEAAKTKLDGYRTACDAAINARDAKVFTDAVAAITASGGGTDYRNDKAIDAALEMYEGLSAGAKAVAGVEAAKSLLDGYRTACDAAIIAENSRAFIAAYDAVKDYAGTNLDEELGLIEDALDAYELLNAEAKTANADKKTELDGLKTTCLAEIASRDAQEFIDAVDAIGSSQITVSSREAIDDAYDLYEALSPEALAVEGVNDKKNDLDGYDEQCVQEERKAKAQIFIDAVDAIDLATLTLEDESDVLAARALYAGLDQHEVLVEGVADALAELVLLEAKIVELKDAAEALLRDDFINKANLLPEVSELKTSDEAKLLAAEAAYALLNADSKALEAIATEYAKVTACRTKMNSFQKITITGSNLLANQGGILIQMTSYVWDSLATFYGCTVGQLGDKAELFLNAYLNSESNNQNYVARLKLNVTTPNMFVSAADIKAVLDMAALNNPDVVSGTYKFTLSIEDLTGEYRNSDFYGSENNTSPFSGEKPTFTITPNAQAVAFLAAAEAIGNVEYTDESNALIVAAENAYKSVNASYKDIQRIVDAYAIVTAARTRYNELKEAQDLLDDIAEFNRLVGLIPETLTEESVALIEAAESFYEDNKDRITGGEGVAASLAKLEAAREAYDLEFGPEAEAGIAFVVMVGKLPEVAGLVYATHHEAVEAARDAQEALVGKGLLVNGYTEALAKLEALEAQIEVLLGLGVDAANAYVQLVEAIGTVTYTPESLALIEAAEEAYETLKPEAFVNETKAAEIAAAKVIMDAARDLYEELKVIDVPFVNITSAGGWSSEYYKGAWYLSVPNRGAENNWWRNEIHFNVSELTAGETLTLVFRGDAGEGYLLKDISGGNDYLVSGLASQTTFVADGTIQTFVMDLTGRNMVGMQELGIFHRDGSKAATFEIYDLIPSNGTLNETALAAANTYLGKVNVAIAVEEISAAQLASLNEIKEEYATLAGKTKIYSGGAYRDLEAYLTVYNAASTAADAFVAAVGELPELGFVVLSDLTAINEARTLYGNLSELAKTKDGVSAASERLEALYQEYLGKKAQADADAFYLLVNAIPENDIINSKSEIEAAEVAYQELSDAAKAIVNLEADTLALLNGYRVEFDASTFAAQVVDFKDSTGLEFPADVSLVSELVSDYESLSSSALSYFNANFATAKEKYDEIVAAYDAYVDSLGVILETTLPETLTINAGASSIQYTATITQGTLNTVTWSSSAPSIATVSDGVITGVTAGTATITVTSDDDPTKSFSCALTVNADPFASYTQISTSSQLSTFISSSNASSKGCLVADIDMSGGNLELFKLKGTLNGRGHIISNFVVPASGEYLQSTFVLEYTTLVGSLSSGINHQGLFGFYANGGTIRHCLFDVTFGTGNSPQSVFGRNAAGAISVSNVFILLRNCTGGQKYAGFIQPGSETFNRVYSCGIDGTPIQGNGPTSLPEAQFKIAANWGSWDDKIWTFVDGSFPALKVF